MSDDFWAVIDSQLARLRTASSVDQVLAICPDRSAGDGFFAGSGGEDSVYEALRDAGWSVVWAEADYHWCMRSPTGDELTYVEGDLYRGNRK